MPVAANRVYPLPFSSFCVVSFNAVYGLFGVAGPASHDHQLAPHETYQVLVAAYWDVIVVARRSSPVPGSIAMFNQPPDIVESRY